MESSRGRDFRPPVGSDSHTRSRAGLAGSQRQSAEEVKCFNCGRDHYKRQCQLPLRTCYSCGQQGHMQ